MGATKEKIRKAALKLFNENGLVNVRLQHIADSNFDYLIYMDTGLECKSRVPKRSHGRTCFFDRE